MLMPIEPFYTQILKYHEEIRLYEKLIANTDNEKWREEWLEEIQKAKESIAQTHKWIRIWEEHSRKEGW